MFDKIPDFLKFFVTLTNRNRVQVILISVIFAMGYFTYSLQQERDNYKDRYDTLYVKYTASVDKAQATQNKISVDCDTKFKEYREKKDAEVSKLMDQYLVKYNELLVTYQELLKNKQ